jgi:ABC-type amino acid transport substrate-binding protein
VKRRQAGHRHGPDVPTLEFSQDGKLVGFDIDLGRRLASKIEVRAEFVPVDWVWQDSRPG